MKFVFFLLFLCSCGARGPLFFEAPMAIQGEVSFQNLKTSIIETKCLSCHSDFAEEKNLLPYIDGNDPDKSKLFEVVKDGSMPIDAPQLTSIELEMVRSYITSIEIGPFQKLKNEVLVPKCLGCHKKMGDEENLKKWGSKLLLRTQDGTMPKNGTPLNAKEMKLIRDYLNSFVDTPQTI